MDDPVDEHDPHGPQEDRRDSPPPGPRTQKEARKPRRVPINQDGRKKAEHHMGDHITAAEEPIQEPRPDGAPRISIHTARNDTAGASQTHGKYQDSFNKSTLQCHV